MALPLLGLLYLSVGQVADKYRLLSEDRALQQLATLTVSVSDLLDEEQKERGSTNLFISSLGTRFGDELRAQRALTDTQLAALQGTMGTLDQAALGGELSESLQRALAPFQELPQRRVAADSLNRPAGELFDYYTAAVDGFMVVLSEVPARSTNAEITRAAAAYTNLLQAKEQMAKERGLMSGVFAADRFGPGVFNRFSAFVAAQDTYTRVFQSLATVGQRAVYVEKLRGPAVEEPARMRQVAFERATEGGFGVDGPRWFALMTDKISLLDEVEQRVAGDLQGRSDALADQARKALTWAVLLGVVGVGASLLLGYWIARGISRPLQALATAAAAVAAVAAGDVEQDVRHTSRDEVGAVAGSLRHLVGVLRALTAETTELIRAAQAGELATRGDASSFQGAFRTLVEGINGTLDAVVAPVSEASAVLTAVAGRDLSVRMQGAYRGDFATIKDALNTAVQNLDDGLGQVAAGGRRLRTGGHRRQPDRRREPGPGPGRFRTGRHAGGGRQQPARADRRHRPRQRQHDAGP